MSIRQAPEEIAPLTPNKKRRMEEKGQPSTLKRRLDALLQEGGRTDVELVVTTENGEIVKRLPAHKNILVAMSSVIATKMTRRWEEGQGRDVVEIPCDFGVDVVEEFLKFLYTKKLEEDLSVDVLLELVFLADHYQVEDLLDFSDNQLIDELNLGNCIQIFEKSRLFQDAKCAKSAFKRIQKSVLEIFENFPNEWIKMDVSTMRAILESNYLPNIQEIDLFKGLKRWKDENLEERASDFQELVKLIRFPLIGVEDFAEFVVPSRDLDAEFIIQMFVYFLGKGPIPEQFENFQQRNLLQPKNSRELEEFIQESQSGDVIELKGTYTAYFSFIIPETKTNLTIRGKKGEEAIIKATDCSGIEIYGQACKINEISIISNISEEHPYIAAAVFVKRQSKQNELRNIQIVGGYHGLIIQGGENSISDISITDTGEAGVLIEEKSYKNEVSNCSIIFNKKETDGFAIYGYGQNKFSNLSCENAANYLECGRNFLDGWKILGGWLEICDGDNCLKNVEITGENSALTFYNNRVDDVKLDNCVADQIVIKGRDHMVKNLKGTKIWVRGKGHKFTNCESEVLNLVAGMEIESTNCTFKVTERV